MQKRFTLKKEECTGMPAIRLVPKNEAQTLSATTKDKKIQFEKPQIQWPNNLLNDSEHT